MNLKTKLIQFAGEAKDASRVLAELSRESKRRILNDVAVQLKKVRRQILAANQKDLKTSGKINLTEAMIDRLTLDPKRIDQIAGAISDVA